jgi:isoquinoline 1-oxidoreductase alpha subunit
MSIYSLNVNGQPFEVHADPDTPLLWILRDHLELFGTKYGCGIGQCGLCTVHLNGTAIRACTYPVSGVGQSHITTIEGLSENGTHPVQKAWKQHDVPQCGYCQAGQIMTAAAFLDNTPHPTEEEIASAMDGVLCRCGTYCRIREAVQTAAQLSK